MKKYYILAFTFLGILCGQLGYGQTVTSGETYNDLYLSLNQGNYTNINGNLYINDSWYLGQIDEVEIYKYKKFDWSANDFWLANKSISMASNCDYCSTSTGDGNTGGGGNPSFADGGPCNITECSAGWVLDQTICQCVKVPCEKVAKENISALVYDTENGLQTSGDPLPNNVTIVPPSELPSGIEFTNSNGFISALYRVDNGNGNIEFVYATAGTSITDIQDIINDAQQAGGFTAPQYQLSVDNAILLRDWAASNNYSLSFTGHSLGGGLANANALATGLPATIYNPAGLNDLTISNDPRLHLYNSGNVTAYVVQGEPIDFINTLFQTPIRGNVIPIGSIAYPAIMYGVSSAAAVISAGTGSALFGIAAISLHSMSNVISDIDCN